MRIKVLIPNDDGSDGGSWTLQDVDKAPMIGDVLLYEGGFARLITFVVEGGNDPDGADFVCRAAPGTGTVIKGRNVTF
ncbi:hypothetical protein HNP47_000082 [Brevundimonas vesicularis]|uniref:Uncharacterized protein n=1 Tax=Brevundimonas vesicularis TaxID=41276 RepID=A0A7W9L4A2_BREVE|nr:hypothetical protein [Brevundimonas vesicularis]MBB5770113.1 hypothetical protein [Brevundimonas vesicularis]